MLVLLLQGLDKFDTIIWVHWLACVPESGLGTVQYVLCTGLAPLSHPSEPFLSHLEARLRRAFEFSHAIQQPASIMGTGPVQSTRSPTPIDEPTHDSLALDWQDWVLSGLWSLPSKAAPRFGLKRSFQSLLLDGTWNPGQKFSILCLARAQAPDQQSSQFLHAFANYRRSVPSHGARPAAPLAATWKSCCSFPHGPPGHRSEYSTAQSAVACTRY